MKLNKTFLCLGISIAMAGYGGDVYGQAGIMPQQAYPGKIAVSAQSGNKVEETALRFIENKGQIKDQYGIERKDIDFKVAGSGLNMYISAGKLHYQWYAMTNAGSSAEKLDMYRMDVELEGANRWAKPEVAGALP